MKTLIAIAAALLAFASFASAGHPTSYRTVKVLAGYNSCGYPVYTYVKQPVYTQPVYSQPVRSCGTSVSYSSRPVVTYKHSSHPQIIRNTSHIPRPVYRTSTPRCSSTTYYRR